MPSRSFLGNYSCKETVGSSPGRLILSSVKIRPLSHGATAKATQRGRQGRPPAGLALSPDPPPPRCRRPYLGKMKGRRSSPSVLRSRSLPSGLTLGVRSVYLRSPERWRFGGLPLISHIRHPGRAAGHPDGTGCSPDVGGAATPATLPHGPFPPPLPMAELVGGSWSIA